MLMRFGWAIEGTVRFVEGKVGELDPLLHKVKVRRPLVVCTHPGA